MFILYMKKVKEIGLVITNETSLKSKMDEMQAVVSDLFFHNTKDGLQFFPCHVLLQV